MPVNSDQWFKKSIFNLEGPGVTSAISFTFLWISVKKHRHSTQTTNFIFFFNIRKFQGPTRWSWFSSHTNHHPLPHTIFPEDQLSIAGGLIINKPAATFTKSSNFSALIWTYKYCSFEPIIVVKLCNPERAMGSFSELLSYERKKQPTFILKINNVTALFLVQKGFCEGQIPNTLRGALSKIKKINSLFFKNGLRYSKKSSGHMLRRITVSFFLKTKIFFIKQTYTLRKLIVQK